MVTNGTTQSSLNYSAPNFNRYKFQSTNPLLVTGPTINDDSAYDTHIVETSVLAGTTNQTIYWHHHIGIGTDLSLIFWINVPLVYDYGTLPGL